MIKTYGLTHLALAVRDVDRASAFYRQVFGAVEVYRQDGFVQMQTPGTRDVLVFEQRATHAGKSGGIAHFGFRLQDPKDINAAVHAVEKAGGTIKEQGEFVAGEPYLFATDPDGYEFEIWYRAADPCRSAGAVRLAAPIIVITGASRGIGAATARLAGERGYAVCVNYLQNREAADAVVADIDRAGGRALAVQADVAVEAEVVRLFETVDGEFGVPSALVNNAGILERQARVEDVDAARLARVLATNVTGAFLCSREAVRRMSTAHGGSGGTIVNVSSRAAQLGAPGEYVDYAASKAALDALTIGLAREVAAEGIRVNAVRAGIIYTDIHASGGEPGRVDRLGPTLPMKRGGLAIEVARAIMWLVSDEASYSAGTFIDVTGGR